MSTAMNPAMTRCLGLNRFSLACTHTHTYTPASPAMALTSLVTTPHSFTSPCAKYSDTLPAWPFYVLCFVNPAESSVFPKPPVSSLHLWRVGGFGKQRAGLLKGLPFIEEESIDKNAGPVQHWKLLDSHELSLMRA